jgi:hypothetical protein
MEVEGGTSSMPQLWAIKTNKNKKINNKIVEKIHSHIFTVCRHGIKFAPQAGRSLDSKNVRICASLCPPCKLPR